jgi:hypothetical protein
VRANASLRELYVDVRGVVPELDEAVALVKART